MMPAKCAVIMVDCCGSGPVSVFMLAFTYRAAMKYLLMSSVICHNVQSYGDCNKAWYGM